MEIKREKRKGFLKDFRGKKKIICVCACVCVCVCVCVCGALERVKEWC